MIADKKCKVCRRAGEKLFLRGDRCFTPKCAMVKKPYPPGKLQSEKKHKSTVTEFGRQMMEKQKLRNSYGLRERQFSKYVREAMARKDIAPVNAIYETLERRLDNVVFRIGFTPSRALARQMVSHGHIIVNGRKVTIPSYMVRPQDVVTVREGSKTSPMFTEAAARLEKHTSPRWMTLDSKNLGATVTALPHAEKAEIPFNLAQVVEFYSR